MSFRTCLVVALVGIAWSCVLGLQRPPPRYSQQLMPDTAFSCRNKIVGSYYADPETDCQLFHVCVSVAGSIQDYKFLCPNDTAFDQESQTCADWYDVDCEAATLYYASDNFDLYRLGSGLESLHYDSVRSDSEPQDNLQRSETSDAIRSSANNLNRASANDNSNANSRDILRGSSSINFYNSRNGGKDEDYENEKVYKEEPVPDARKKNPGVRKIARKQQQNFGNNYASSSTVAPVVASSPIANNYNGNYNNYNRQRSSVSPSSTISSSVAPENYNVRNQNNQKYNVPTTTYRPSTGQQTFSTHQSPVTTVRTTGYNNYNNNNNNNNAYNTNSQQQQTSNSYGQNIVTSPKPTTYSQNYPSSTVTTQRTTSYSQNYQEQQNYKNQYSQFGQSIRAQSTTVQPSTSYQTSDYTNYQRSYNNIQRSTNSPNTFSTTIATPTTFKDTYSNNHGNTYTPTTYKPPSTNNRGSTNERYNGQSSTNDNGQYNNQPSKSTQYHDSTRSTKKASQYTGNYDTENNGKYYESSTGSYEIVRSQAGIGFSPSSINHLAETPRSTTPVPKRTASPTTYNPQTFNVNNQRQTQQTTPRGTTYVSPSARPFSTTPRLNDPTTPRPKSEKKNDYDYAYYDNAGGLEYDGLDLEHVVAGNKESSKISRN